MNRSVKILAVALAIVMPMAWLTTDSDADGTSDSVLIDLGNGTTVWYAIPGASDPVSLGKAAAEANSMDYVESDDGFSMIGGMTEHNVGTQECSWRFYAWTASGWVATAPSDKRRLLAIRMCYGRSLRAVVALPRSAKALC